MKVMLTTIDNPFDPIEDFKNWFSFDIEKGYNSCAYLSRIAKTSDSLTEEDVEYLIHLDKGMRKKIEKMQKLCEKMFRRAGCNSNRKKICSKDGSCD